jgi:hypothetical protein
MSEKILMEAKGHNGQLQLLEDSIRIKRRKPTPFIGHEFMDDKDILIERISSLQFKKASLWSNGYIQFSFISGKEARGKSLLTPPDESIVFTARQQSAFVKIKEAIAKKMDFMKERSPKPSYLDEIERLVLLRDKNVITKEEFEAKIKKLLNLS